MMPVLYTQGPEFSHTKWLQKHMALNAVPATLSETARIDDFSIAGNDHVTEDSLKKSP